MKKRIGTMEELSEFVGLSRPTLSKYFQNPGSVRANSRQKIEQALAEVDYVPHFFARSMNLRKTRLIGVIIPHLNDLFYTSLIEAIEKIAYQHDHKIIIQNSHGKPELECAALDNLRSMKLDGVIIAPIGMETDIDLLERTKSELPVVLVDSQLPGTNIPFPFVGTNNHQSIKLMVDYLCRSGNPPVFLNMPKVNNNAEERMLAYENRMHELGYEPVVISCSDDQPTWAFEDYAYHNMKNKFLKGEYLESTILCANDRLAMGVLRAAQEVKLFEIKKDAQQRFRVAGHDNHPLSGFMWPSLTTAEQNIEMIARESFDILLQSANSSKQDQEHDELIRLLDAQLILRESA